jgi:hypothetical protein
MHITDNNKLSNILSYLYCLLYQKDHAVAMVVVSFSCFNY